VTLTRRFDDDPATVFRAFTDPAALRLWWGPRDFRIEAIEFPAVEGRRYHVQLTAPDGSHWAHEGRFLTVEPPHRLAYTWQWTHGPLSRVETLVDLTFTAEGQGCLLTVSHSRFASDEERSAHHVGWTDTFDRVTAWLARAGAP
jgi:uncharacterized protein YndB with AHSA1/START domain